MAQTDTLKYIYLAMDGAVVWRKENRSEGETLQTKKKSVFESQLCLSLALRPLFKLLRLHTSDLPPVKSYLTGLFVN